MMKPTTQFLFALGLSAGAAFAAPPEMDVHVTIMTEKLQGAGETGADGRQRRSEKVRERWQSHVDKLNEEFRAETGELLVRFRLHSVTLYVDAKKSHCEKALDLAGKGESFSTAILKCDDPAIRMPGAVNIYVYAPRSKEGEPHRTSRGGHNAEGPFALIHWQRYHDFNTVWHELGHAFGLPHVCSSPRPEGTHWNIMATPDTCKSAKEIVTGFHFDEKQTRTVKAHAEKYLKLFARH